MHSTLVAGVVHSLLAHVHLIGFVKCGHIIVTEHHLTAWRITQSCILLRKSIITGQQF